MAKLNMAWSKLKKIYIIFFQISKNVKITKKKLKKYFLVRVENLKNGVRMEKNKAKMFFLHRHLFCLVYIGRLVAFVKMESNWIFFLSSIRYVFLNFQKTSKLQQQKYFYFLGGRVDFFFWIEWKIK